MRVDGGGRSNSANPTAWAFRGPACVPVSDIDAGAPGVFDSKANCELQRACDTSKLTWDGTPWCFGLVVVAPGTVPPVPAYRVGGDVWWLWAPTIATMCRTTLAPNVVSVTCEFEE